MTLQGEPYHEKHSGGAKRQGADSPRECPCGLPHDTLWPLLLVCLRRGLHADAGVRAGFVVEGDETGDALQCILVRLEALLTVDDLGLEYAVHTLGYGIIGWFVVLRHADFDAVLLQFGRELFFSFF